MGTNASLLITNGRGGGCGFKNQEISTRRIPVVLGEVGDIFSAFPGSNCILATTDAGMTCSYVDVACSYIELGKGQGVAIHHYVMPS